MPDGTFKFPPGTQEAWSNLAKQLPASKGEFAGPSQSGNETTEDGGKQWMRAISLVVYQAVSSSGPDQEMGGGGDKPGASPTRRLRQPFPRDIPSTTLDEVKVEAKAPEQKEPSSQGLELAALRVTFNVHSSTVTSPQELDARIYNLSPQTMKKVIQFGRVKLTAGYKYGQYGVIFDGKVVQYRRGKENPTDTYLEIKGFDGDELSKSISVHRFEAGQKEAVAIKQFIKDTGIKEGHVSDKVGTQLLVRPWVVAGMTQKYLRDMMLKYNANCFPSLGKLHVVPQREYLPGEKVILSPRTGLVGIPEATPEGIQIRCLLNPRIKIGGIVKLDNSLISGVAFIPGGGPVDENTFYSGQFSDATMGQKVSVPVPTSPIGEYKVYMIEYTGDTRGQPWYCDLICVGLNANGEPMGTVGSVYYRNPDAGKPSSSSGSPSSGGPPSEEIPP